MNAFDIVNYPQNSVEWLQWRRGKIGASDAPVIMGVSPYKTPLQLWEEQVYGKTQETNAAMQMGKDIEPIARAQINLDNKTNYQPTCMQSKRRNWMIASLDGWDEKSPSSKILEIKNANAEDHEIARKGKIPEHHYPQLQHQMIVSGQEEVLYLSWSRAMGVKVIVQRDEDYCKILIEREEEFYDRLNSFKAPSPTDKDVVEVNDDTAIILARSYRAVQTKIDELTKEKEEIREALINSISHPRANVGDLKLRRDLVRGRIEYDKIEILKEIDLEPYRKPPQMVWKIFS